MANRSKNVNLNKEPFEGFVNHWKRQWVSVGADGRGGGSSGEKGPKPARLLKWVNEGKGERGKGCLVLCSVWECGGRWL